MAERTLRVVIVGDAASLERSLGRAGRSAEAFQTRTQKLGAALGTALKYGAIAAGIGVAAVTVGLVESAKAAAHAQVEEAKLKTAVDNAGVSWRKYGGYIDRTLTSQARMSGFMRTDLSNSFSRLVTATGSATQAARLNALAMDVSRARNIDVATSSTLLAKAWNGNTTSLMRMGIVVPKVTAAQDALKASTSKATAEQVKAAKAADLVSTRQAILAALQKKFGGQAEAYGKTAAGAWDRVKVAVHELEVSIGKHLLPILAPALERLAHFVDLIGTIASAKSPTVALRIVWANLRGAAGDLVSALKTELFGGAAKPLVLPTGKFLEWQKGDTGLVAKLQSALSGVDWGRVGRQVAAGISTGLVFTQDQAGRLVGSLVSGIVANSGAIANAGALIALKIVSTLLDPSFWAAHWQLIAGIALALLPASKFGEIGAVLGRGLGSGALRLFGEAVGRMPSVVGRVLATVVEDSRSAWGRIGAFIVDRMLSAGGRLPGIFQRAALGIVDHFSAAWLSIRGDAGKAFDWIGGKIRGSLVGSIGVFLVKLGLVQGAFNAIRSAVEWVIRKVQDLGNAISSLPSLNIKLPHIPFTASGGVAMRPQVRIVAEAGPEAIIPLSQAGRYLGGGVGGGLTVNLTVEGSVVTHQDLVRAVRDSLVQLGVAQSGRAGLFQGRA